MADLEQKDKVARPKWWGILAAIVLFTAFMWFAWDVTKEEPDLLMLVLQLLAGLIALVVGMVGGGPPVQDVISKLGRVISTMKRGP
ncbi:MAG: hypothetical protein AAF141_05830 [Pseudomonadota bacterium]